MRPNHLAIGLSVSAVLCCLVAGAGMSQAPIMSGGRHPSLSEVAGMIAVPTVVAALATWAACSTGRSCFVSQPRWSVSSALSPDSPSAAHSYPPSRCLSGAVLRVSQMACGHKALRRTRIPVCVSSAAGGRGARSPDAAADGTRAIGALQTAVS